MKKKCKCVCCSRRIAVAQACDCKRDDCGLNYHSVE